jgi:hypothetical protein
MGKPLAPAFEYDALHGSVAAAGTNEVRHNYCILLLARHAFYFAGWRYAY